MDFKGCFHPKLFYDSIKSSGQTRELQNTTLGSGAARGHQKGLRSYSKEHRPTSWTTPRVTQKPARRYAGQSKRSLFSNLEGPSTHLGMEHKSLRCSFKLIHGKRLGKRQKVSKGDADQWFGEFLFWPITKDQKGKGHRGRSWSPPGRRGGGCKTFLCPIPALPAASLTALGHHKQAAMKINSLPVLKPSQHTQDSKKAPEGSARSPMGHEPG